MFLNHTQFLLCILVDDIDEDFDETVRDVPVASEQKNTESPSHRFKGIGCYNT